MSFKNRFDGSLDKIFDGFEELKDLFLEDEDSQNPEFDKEVRKVIEELSPILDKLGKLYI